MPCWGRVARRPSVRRTRAHDACAPHATGNRLGYTTLAAIQSILSARANFNAAGRTPPRRFRRPPGRTEEKKAAAEQVEAEIRERAAAAASLFAAALSGSGFKPPAAPTAGAAFLQQQQQLREAAERAARAAKALQSSSDNDVASKAPQPPLTASIEVHVQSMDIIALVEALSTLGVSAGTTKDHQLHERLLELVKPEGPDPVGWEKALVAARRRCLLRFLADCGRTESDAERVADEQLDGRGSAAEFRAMWDGLVAQYCPRAPTPPDRSSSGKVLVIAPGFGFMANSAQILVLERAFGAAVVRSNQHANPEGPSFGMTEAMKQILREIDEHKPKAILCASKGGVYMAELWRRMEEGGHDHLKGISYLMINARPSVTRLPSGVKVIMVQGAKEQMWPRPRGYSAAGKVEDGSLEALIRTGSPGLCYLYHTPDVRSGLGHRKGDEHVPASLLQYDCLPRLVDALFSPSPSSAFQASSRAFASTERMAAENGLGWHPDTLRSRFVGHQLRVEVPEDSDEFKNVETIFKADPATGVNRFYFNDRGTEHLDITKVERVQNPELKDSVDDKRGRFKKMLESFGEQYEAGVHSRWLFHGAGSADALENIIDNPMTGFAPQMGLGNGGTNLWGYGSYFARDASYSVHAG